MIAEYWEKITCKIIDVLELLKFNGDDVLTPSHTSGRGLQVKNVADPTDPQDAVTLSYLETQQGGAAVTKVNLESPVNGNVTIDLDSVAQAGNTSSVHLKVPEDVYGVTWATSPEVPTKKNLYAKIDTLVVKEEGKTLMSEEDATKLANAPEVMWVQLPSASTVANRIAGGVTGSEGIDTWSFAPGASPVDLVITHNKDKRVAAVSVFAIDGTQEQQLFNTAAYNGIITPDTNNLRIQSLATITKAIKIYITFA